MGEKDENIKLMYSLNGKNFEEVKPIDSLCDVSHEDIVTTYKDGFKGGEMSFTCNGSTWSELLEAVLGRTSFIRYCQLTKSNNWLRRRGLPMRRMAR